MKTGIEIVFIIGKIMFKPSVILHKTIVKVINIVANPFMFKYYVSNFMGGGGRPSLIRTKLES